MSFDMKRFREELKAQRKKRVGSRARLIELCGEPRISPTTIQNAEQGPDVPGISTIARLIEAMPGLTLADFFLQIERQTDGDLPARAIEGRSGRTPGGEVTRGHRPSVPPDHDIRAAVGQALLRAAAALTDAAATGSIESADREVPRARGKKRGRR